MLKRFPREALGLPVAETGLPRRREVTSFSLYRLLSTLAGGVLMERFLLPLILAPTEGPELLVWVVPPPPLLLVSDPESRRLSGGVVLRLFFVAALEAAKL